MNLNWLILVILLTQLKFSASKKRCKKINSGSNCQEDGKECPFKKVENYYQETECTPFIDYVVSSDKEKPEVSMQKTLSPLNCACLACELCITVAEKLSKKLASKLLAEQHPDKKSATQQRKELVNIRDICSDGFQKYEFQELMGEQFIGLVQPHTKPIATGDKETWSEKLKDTCYTLLTFYGERNIIDDWENDHNSLKVSLCRGNGVFGACNYLNNKRKEEEEDDDDDDDDDYGDDDDDYNIEDD